MTKDIGLHWKQHDNRVMIYVPHWKQECYFIVPDDFRLSDIHPDLIRLCELIMIPRHKPKYNFTRQPGDQIGLAFSGGTDSSAAYCLLRKLKPHLFYLMRDNIAPTSLRHDNALKTFNDNNLNVRCMKTDSELLRKSYKPGDIHGFVTDYHAAIPAILLADYYNLGYISTGLMLSSAFLWKGYRYRDFSVEWHWKYWDGLFKQAGLQFFNPVMPCSEVLTNHIVQQSGFKSESCIYGNKQPCLTCVKCFRKQAIMGFKIENPSQCIRHYLKARPLIQGASMIYANNRFQVGIPELAEFEHLDVSWQEQYHIPSIALAPKKYQAHLTTELQKYAHPMIGNEIEHFDIGI